MTETLDVGDQARIEGVFTDPAGAALSPTALSVTVKFPSGNPQTFVLGTDSELSEVVAGTIRLLLPITLAGLHKTNWRATAGVIAAGSISFQVRQPYENSD